MTKVTSVNQQEHGQAIVIVALAMVAIVILFALILDGGRLFVERQQLQRAAEGASQAGASMVGDLIVTRAVMRQATAAAQPSYTPTTTPPAIPPPTATATPLIRDGTAWLTAEDITWLTTSPAALTPVAATAEEYAARNNAGRANPQVTLLQVTYPYNYATGDKVVRVRLRINRNTDVLLVGVWDRTQVSLAGDSTNLMQIIK